MFIHLSSYLFGMEFDKFLFCFVFIVSPYLGSSISFRYLSINMTIKENLINLLFSFFLFSRSKGGTKIIHIVPSFFRQFFSHFQEGLFHFITLSVP